MFVKIEEISHILEGILKLLNVSEKESKSIVNNIIEAEICGKKSHGFVSFLHYCRNLKQKNINTNIPDLKILNQDSNVLHIDGENHLGAFIIDESLNVSISMLEKYASVNVGISNLWHSGYIGAYAREVAERGYIFIAFHNARKSVAPWGSCEKFFGTNPITIGIPGGNSPIILDMASSSRTMGDILLADKNNTKIEEGFAIDKSGKPLCSPKKILDSGALLPLGEHKGSGLAFVAEILAGVLTQSTNALGEEKGGYGGFYALFNPGVFMDLNIFKKNVDSYIKDFKNLSRADGFSELYFAGEQSNFTRLNNLQKGTIDIDIDIYNSILKFEGGG